MITRCNGGTNTGFRIDSCCYDVTAGVFLVIRCSYLFEQNKNILVVVGLVGGLTCFFSAIIGSFQFDIKKIVAYSTCSHLVICFLVVECLIIV
jgi:NADH:ubiquinone oxidoreductase subunit 5 (subunit L)/multisubunit Na+/H+ antiporter MnhA subunit